MIGTSISKMEVSDRDLLIDFAQSRSEDAFRTLVDRHLPMVFGVALRVTACASLAEEVAQSTFAKLAHHANGVDKGIVIGGWLYNTARNAALTSARSERRRRECETLSTEMNPNELDHPLVVEHLEEAMSQLKEDDRCAIVLRYFEDRNLREIGRELGISEDAARMRVNRALSKLKNSFGKLGVTGTAAWFASAIPCGASTTLPAGLSASIISSALASGIAVGSAAAVVTETATSTMGALIKIKTATVILAAAAITGTATYVAKDDQLEDLRKDLNSLNERRSQLESKLANAAAKTKMRDAQIMRQKLDNDDLHRLRGEVDRLNRLQAAMNSVQLRTTSSMVKLSH